MRNRILVACVGVPVILVVLYVLPAPFTPALIAVLSAVGTYEALHAIGMNHPRIALYTAIVALAIPFWVYFGEPRQWGLLVLLVYLLATLLPNALCDVRQVELRVDGNAVILPAMLDSGNLLRDPVTGLPVLVVPRKAARLLFPGVYDLGDLASLPLGFRLLNVRTAAGSALLPLFRPDECRLYLNGHPSEARLLVAVAGPEYGGAQALVPMAALSASFS